VVKKTVKKIATKDADQYMLRLPPGLRDQVARRAAENGRSMNTEIIDAIEKHLRDADRVTQLWDLFEQHRENLEAIPHIWDAVEHLEHQVERLTGDSMGPLTSWRYEMEEKAREAARPPITTDQVAAIRGLIKETRVNEAKLLELLRVPGVEEIKDFNRAMSILDQVRQKKDPPE
jgi:predicted DNA-binding protein